MTVLRVTFFVAGLLSLPAKVETAPVLMISIDGLRPGDVLDVDARAIQAPTLKAMAAECVYACGVPARPEMRATLILAGPGIAKRGSPGEADMRDVAPTLAKVKNIKLPDADGRPLF